MSHAPRQYVILSLPSCGTDWLAGCVVKANPELRYHREFFNPICNLTHYDRLAPAFGCELVQTVGAICLPWRFRQRKLEFAYQSTWVNSGFNLTKENYSPFAAGFFAQRFQCVLLHRGLTSTFPPKRLRVVAWYNAIWESLRRNAVAMPPRFRMLLGTAERLASDPLRRAVAAHAIAFEHLLDECHGLGIKALDYEVLTAANLDSVRQNLLERLPAELRPHDVAEMIAATRDGDRARRDATFAKQWSDALKMARDLQPLFTHQQLL